MASGCRWVRELFQKFFKGHWDVKVLSHNLTSFSQGQNDKVNLQLNTWTHIGWRNLIGWIFFIQKLNFLWHFDGVKMKNKFSSRLKRHLGCRWKLWKVFGWIVCQILFYLLGKTSLSRSTIIRKKKKHSENSLGKLYTKNTMINDILFLTARNSCRQSHKIISRFSLQFSQIIRLIQSIKTKIQFVQFLKSSAAFVVVKCNKKYKKLMFSILFCRDSDDKFEYAGVNGSTWRFLPAPIWGGKLLCYFSYLFQVGSSCRCVFAAAGGDVLMMSISLSRLPCKIDYCVFSRRVAAALVYIFCLSLRRFISAIKKVEMRCMNEFRWFHFHGRSIDGLIWFFSLCL